MSLLRSDSLVALNDLLVACREAASCHRTAADTCPDPDIAKDLAALAQDREDMAENLAETLIAMDDIPNAPNEEKELIEATLTRVKSLLGESEILQLLEDCRTKEQRVAEAADVAVAQKLDKSLQRKIASLRDDATSRMADLNRRYASSRRKS